MGGTIQVPGNVAQLSEALQFHGAPVVRVVFCWFGADWGDKERTSRASTQFSIVLLRQEEILRIAHLNNASSSQGGWSVS